MSSSQFAFLDLSDIGQEDLAHLREILDEKKCDLALPDVTPTESSAVVFEMPKDILDLGLEENKSGISFFVDDPADVGLTPAPGPEEEPCITPPPPPEEEGEEEPLEDPDSTPVDMYSHPQMPHTSLPPTTYLGPPVMAAPLPPNSAPAYNHIGGPPPMPSGSLYVGGGAPGAGPHHPLVPHTVHIENCHVNLSPFGPNHPGPPQPMYAAHGPPYPPPPPTLHQVFHPPPPYVLGGETSVRDYESKPPLRGAAYPRGGRGIGGPRGGRGGRRKGGRDEPERGLDPGMGGDPSGGDKAPGPPHFAPPLMPYPPYMPCVSRAHGGGFPVLSPQGFLPAGDPYGGTPTHVLAYPPPHVTMMAPDPQEHIGPHHLEPPVTTHAPFAQYGGVPPPPFEADASLGTLDDASRSPIAMEEAPPIQNTYSGESTPASPVVGPLMVDSNSSSIPIGPQVGENPPASAPVVEAPLGENPPTSHDAGATLVESTPISVGAPSLVECAAPSDPVGEETLDEETPPFAPPLRENTPPSPPAACAPTVESAPLSTPVVAPLERTTPPAPVVPEEPLEAIPTVQVPSPPPSQVQSAVSAPPVPSGGSVPPGRPRPREAVVVCSERPSKAQHVSPWAQKKSWSQLFKNGDEGGAPTKQVALVPPFNAQEDGSGAFPPPNKVDLASPSEVDGDLHKRKIGAMLRDYTPNYRPVQVQPRGLINKNYWCYVNAPLQALLTVPSFYQLATTLSKVATHKSGSQATPFINSIVDFAGEFNPVGPGPSGGQRAPRKKEASTEVAAGPPFEPTSVYRLLTECKENPFTEGRQQDAEEMLSCVLNGLHDEMVECMKLAAPTKNGGSASDGPDAPPADDGEEWRVQGPKKKSCVTRTAHYHPSPISDIFWGQLRSILHQAGGTTTANLQPFNTLPLDIQSPQVDTLKDALSQLVTREEISGFTCPRTNQEVTASNQVLFEELPRVLILQLKRFIYDKSGGLQKLTKRLQVPLDLDITKDLLSASSRGKFGLQQRRFRLFALVLHEGKEATKGHYLADVFHGGLGAWLRYDDSSVKVVPEATVLRDEPPRVPYLLFYRRSDMTPPPSKQQ